MTQQDGIWEREKLGSPGEVAKKYLNNPLNRNFSDIFEQSDKKSTKLKSCDRTAVAQNKSILVTFRLILFCFYCKKKLKIQFLVWNWCFVIFLILLENQILFSNSLRSCSKLKFLSFKFSDFARNWEFCFLESCLKFLNLAWLVKTNLALLCYVRLGPIKNSKIRRRKYF